MPGDGPRVRASADPEILGDLAFAMMGHNNFDLLIWGRRVPATWQAMLDTETLPHDRFSQAGTLDRLMAELKRVPFRKSLPPFLIDDVEQTLALTAALAVSNDLTIDLEAPDTFGDRQTGSNSTRSPKLTCLCCYGGWIDWTSSRTPYGDITGSAEPYALAFLPAAPTLLEDALALRCTTSDGPAVMLRIAAY